MTITRKLENMASDLDDALIEESLETSPRASDVSPTSAALDRKE